VLDVIAVRDDLPQVPVEVVDVRLSDHRLLLLSMPLVRPCPVYTSVTGRPWSRLDAAVFRLALLLSPLCSPETWTTLDVDDLAQLHDSTVTTVVDRMIPIRTVRCRRRPSDPCFDQDCRQAQRCVRYLECVSVTRRTDPTDITAVTTATDGLLAFMAIMRCCNVSVRRSEKPRSTPNVHRRVSCLIFSVSHCVAK